MSGKPREPRGSRLDVGMKEIINFMSNEALDFGMGLLCFGHLSLSFGTGCIYPMPVPLLLEVTTTCFLLISRLTPDGLNLC